MKFIAEAVITTLRSQAAACGHALRRVLLYLWDVYSAPTPAGRDILTQLLLCATLSAVTGGLLHHWLCNTLMYSCDASVQTACIYSAAMFLASFLCHPVRCVLTMTLPTACTTQGRRILLSGAVMIVALRVIPNIAVNVGAVAHILRCTAEGFTETLLNSSAAFNMAKQDLVKEAVRVTEDTSVVTNLKELDQLTRVDVSAVAGRFAKLIGQVEANLAHARSLIQECKLLSNRILAAAFVALLVTDSARYLMSHLTSAERKSSGGFPWPRQSTAPAGDERPAKSKANPVCELTRRERTSVFLPLVVVTLYFVAITVTVALDYAVYHTVEGILPWLQDFPPTSAGISVDYEVQVFVSALCIIPTRCTTKELTSFHRDYEWSFSPETSPCSVATSAPSPGVTLLLACLWLTCCSLVFLEVYATRLRRTIAASFFRNPSERKLAYMTRERQARRSKQQQKGSDAFEVSRD